MKSPNVIDAQSAFTLSDEQLLIANAQQGQQQAFQQLYLKYNGKIYALCFRMLAEKTQAEDVCQEVFVQLWQNIHKFRGDSQFSTWLYRVATNCVLSHLRKQKNWIQKMFSFDSQPSLIENHITEFCETQSHLSPVDKAIVRLPEKARIVFVLFAIEGYRHEEIAVKLSIAVGTSKAQYHRAKILLKEWLSDE